jgi:hypothetical protein
LNTRRAETLRLYRLMITNGQPRNARFTSARYNDSDFSVTLTLAMPISRSASFRLTINGTQPNGLIDRQGDPLDGTANGIAGDNFEAFFNNGVLVRPGYLASASPENPAIAPEAVDQLLLANEFQDLNRIRSLRSRIS